MSYSLNIMIEKNELGYVATWSHNIVKDSPLPNSDQLVYQSDSLDQILKELQKSIEKELEEKESLQQKAKKPIWEVALDLIQDMTEEELNQLPVDGAEQHDFYIYGTPKKEHLKHKFSPI